MTKKAKLIIETEEELTPYELFKALQEFFDNNNAEVDDEFINDVMTYACNEVGCTGKQLDTLYQFVCLYKNN